MQYCVIDTERIKGSKIYLLSYMIYDEHYILIESKTLIDNSIDLSNRKAPKMKVKMLWNKSIIVNGYVELYHYIQNAIANKLLIVFSNTDMKAIQTNCNEQGIVYNKPYAIDVQKILFDLSSPPKHKSNLKDFCIKHSICHYPHIPESDCFATFEVYKKLIQLYGVGFINQYRVLLK